MRGARVSTTSMRTPGFAGHPWPDEPMTLERNAGDLPSHEKDFAQRRGFTYSVVSRCR